MKDDPSQIANNLIAQHGVDGALESVREGIATAHADGDNYGLSVWREVRRALRSKPHSADDQEAPEI
jgi:hypothetical protein